MDGMQKHKCALIGMRMCLLCAALAIAAPLIFTVPYMAAWFGYSAADKLITLAAFVFILAIFCVTAILLGRAAGRNICRRRRDSWGAMGVGIGVAMGCLVAAGLAVELAILVATIYSGERPLPGLLLFYILLLGTLPAILLGILYGALLRWRLTKAGCLEEGAGIS
jgi:hypothetical protein